MIDFRIYRAAFIPAVAAFVVMMFSLEGVPAVPDPQIAPASFDGDRARDNVREILALGDDRTPGSEADAGSAAIVLERFEDIEAGTTSRQTFEMDVEGEERQLENVALTLAGESDEVVLVTAPRDSAGGPGAASSAAATAALMELAETLGGTEHIRTFVLVSTDASTEGAQGIREFIDAFENPDRIVAAISLTQPGAAETRAPFVLRHSIDDSSTSMQLVRIAEETLAEQGGREPADPGFLSDLARLAFPTGAGEQSVLISEGVSAVGLSSAGERPLSPEEDGEAQFSPAVLEEFGAAALNMVLVLDPLTQPLDHGPDAYAAFSGSLLPGWAVSVFALSLILPAAVVALDGVARAARRRAGVTRALAWAFALALPLAAAFAAVRVLGGVEVIASPDYPFDLGRMDFGLPELLLVLALGGATAAGYLLSGLVRPPRRPRREALVPALGAAASAGALAVWLFNPYLALLMAPLAHVWLLDARSGRGPRVLAAGVGLLCLLPPVLALLSAVGAVGGGPWDVVVLLADGQIPLQTALAGAPLLGALAGLIVVAWHPPERRTDDPGRIGARPQGAWVPAGLDKEAGSINRLPDTADVTGEREGTP
jgi:hypothetical protein